MYSPSAYHRDVLHSIETLERLLSMDRRDEAVTLELAVLYARNAQRQRAQELLLGYLDSVPGAAPAQRLLTDLGLADWSMQRGNAGRTGVAPGCALRTPPVARWVWQAPSPDHALVYSPIADGRLVILVTADASRIGGFEPFSATMTCVELSSGRAIWSFTRRGVPASPVLAGGKAFWSWLTDGPGGPRHQLAALDAESGATIWRTEVPPAPGCAPYDASPLLVYGDAVYAASNGFRPGFRADGGFFAVCSAESGELLERHVVAGARMPIVHQGHVHFYDDSGVIYKHTSSGLTAICDPISPSLEMRGPISSPSGLLMVLAGDQGTRLVRFREGRPDPLWVRYGNGSTLTQAPCVTPDGRVFVTTASERMRGDVVAFEGHITCIDERTRRVLDERTEPWRPTSSPTVVEDVLYLATELSPFVHRQVDDLVFSDPIESLQIPDGLEFTDHADIIPRALTAYDVADGLAPLWRVRLPDFASSCFEPVPASGVLLVQWGPGRVVALGSTLNDAPPPDLVRG